MHDKMQLLTKALMAFVLVISLAPALPHPALADESSHAYVTTTAEQAKDATAQPGGKVGSEYKIAGNVYRVTSNTRSTVTLAKAKNAKSIVIPATVKIGGKAYRVTVIGSRAFALSKRLVSVRVGSNVARIGTSAFSECPKLARIAGGASVRYIGAFAFDGCRTLKQCDPTSGEKLTRIGACAFKDAKKLKTITVKSRGLKKADVRRALEGSAVSTVKVLVGATKDNKAFAKRYTRLFTKKNCGKKAKVKALKYTLPAPEKPEDTTLAGKWKADFERLAKNSGMEVCVYAQDLSTGASAAYNAGNKVLSASMIKLLVAETFLGQVASGKQALDDVYTLKETDIVGGTGSLGGRGAGAKVTKREMLKLMISESDNVATNVLIDQCSIDAVNKEAKRLGLKCTVLERHMMDTEAESKGLNNYTCADDIAVLLKMVYDKSFVNEEMSALMLEALEAQTDNRCISTGLPAGTKFAHKTGTLSTVRHDGGIVEGKHPFIIVVLCGGKGFSENGAYEVMGQIGKAAYQDLQEAHKGDAQPSAS